MRKEPPAQEWDLLSFPWTRSSLPGPVLPCMQHLSAISLPLPGLSLTSFWKASFLRGVEHLLPHLNLATSIAKRLVRVGMTINICILQPRQVRLRKCEQPAQVTQQGSGRAGVQTQGVVCQSHSPLLLTILQDSPSAPSRQPQLLCNPNPLTRRRIISGVHEPLFSATLSQQEVPG